MSKKIILFVMHELVAGGAERVVVNLANNLDRNKFDVHICLFNKKGWLLDLLKDDVTIHDLKTPRVSRGAIKFPFVLFSLKPDYVFSSIDHVNLLISVQIKLLKLFLRNTKFIAREVNIPSIRAKYEKLSKQDYFYSKTINQYDYLIAQSNYMKDDIVDSYNIKASKITVVPNPLDIRNIERSIKDIDDEKLYSSGKINLLAIGYLRPQKGFDLLLQTVPLLDDSLHLNILGDGAEKDNLDQQIRQLNIADRVTMLGVDENPYKFMKQADMVVLSSLYEGFPNVILEANACGKFVVAFECPGVSAEIIEDSINGVLVDPENIEALAKAINIYATKQHDEKQISNTTDRYKVENVVKVYERLLLGDGI
jgi:glycosyltransferase involved in cell wall biosynthesis